MNKVADTERNDRQDIEENLYRTIGSRMKEFRTKKGMSGDDLARKFEKIGLKCSASYISRWENAEKTHRPKITHLLAFCRIFGISIDNLCGRKNRKIHVKEGVEEYTGLSEKSIEFLHNLDEEDRLTIESVLSGYVPGLESILECIKKANDAAHDASFEYSYSDLLRRSKQADSFRRILLAQYNHVRNKEKIVSIIKDMLDNDKLIEQIESEVAKNADDNLNFIEEDIKEKALHTASSLLNDDEESRPHPDEG